MWGAKPESQKSIFFTIFRKPSFSQSHGFLQFPFSNIRFNENDHFVTMISKSMCEITRFVFNGHRQAENSYNRKRNVCYQLDENENFITCLLSVSSVNTLCGLQQISRTIKNICWTSGDHRKFWGHLFGVLGKTSVIFGSRGKSSGRLKSSWVLGRPSGMFGIILP